MISVPAQGWRRPVGKDSNASSAECPFDSQHQLVIKIIKIVDLLFVGYVPASFSVSLTIAEGLDFTAFARLDGVAMSCTL